MNSLSRLIVLACAMTSLFASGAAAQELPTGGVTPAPRRAGEEDQALEQNERDEPVAGPSLTMRFGFGANQDSALNESTVGQSYSAGLDRIWRLRRGAINLSGDASQFLYSGSRALDQLTFGANLSAAYQLTRRARITLADGISRGYARQTSIDALTSTRLLTPRALTIVHSFGGTYGYDVSPRTQVLGSIQASQVSFDPGDVPTLPGEAPTPAEPALFADGWTYGSRFTLQRQITRTDGLGLVHEYSSYQNGPLNRSTTHAFRALWQRRVGKNFSLSAEGGVNAYLIDGLEGVGTAPTASATIARHFRKSTLALRVERLMEVFGNAHVSEIVNPSYAVTIGSKLTVGLEGTYARQIFPADPKSDYEAFVGTVTARYALPANLVVSGAYTRWDRVLSQPNAPRLATYYSNLTVGYARSWR